MYSRSLKGIDISFSNNMIYFEKKKQSWLHVLTNRILTSFFEKKKPPQVMQVQLPCLVITRSSGKLPFECQQWYEGMVLRGSPYFLRQVFGTFCHSNANFPVGQPWTGTKEKTQLPNVTSSWKVIGSHETPSHGLKPARSKWQELQRTE